MLGDDASGAWLGMQALRHTLLVVDGLAQSNYVAEQLLQMFDNDPKHLKSHFIQASPKTFAQLANLVFDGAEQGDPFAVALLERAVHYIAKLHQRLSEKTPNVALMGGLSDRYFGFLSEKLINNLKKPAGTGVDGAIALTHKRFD